MMCSDRVLYWQGLAKYAKTAQTKVRFNSSSTGGDSDSLADADEQTKEAANQ